MVMLGKIINILSLIVLIPFFVFGVYEAIIGPDDAKKMLKKIHFPLSYKQILIIGFISLAIFLINNLFMEINIYNIYI